MRLEEIKEGTKVMLSVSHQDNVYQIPTQIALNKGKLYLHPFSYKGSIINFEEFSNRHDLSFDLYANDENTQVRYVWKNVFVQVSKVKNKFYYEITTNAFNRIGQVSERREETRIRIWPRGTAYAKSINRYLQIQTYDISNSGIAFLCREKLNLVGETLQVAFEDQINDHAFRLDVRCTCIRIVDQGGTYLYGCQMQNPNKEILAYVCLKGISLAAGKENIS